MITIEGTRSVCSRERGVDTECEHVPQMMAVLFSTLVHTPRVAAPELRLAMPRVESMIVYRKRKPEITMTLSGLPSDHCTHNRSERRGLRNAQAT